MSTPLRPQFFCSRPNGTLTPLIAVDELPPTLSIRGVSRVLTHGDTQGMTSLGTVSPRGQVYVVDTVSPTRTPAAGGRRGRGDAELQSSLSRIISDESIPANQRLALQTLVHQGMPQTWGAPTTPANGWMVPNGGATGHKNAPYNVKEFCSYWIRHGECDYQQQGCLYKHEMPTDPAMLEKLGLRDIPRWYREKFGVPSLLPNGRHNHHNQQWKDETAAADRTAVKAIQYHPHLGQDTSETEKAPKKPTPYFNAPHGAIPDQPRAFMNGLKGPIGQKNGTAAATGIKQISHAHGKKGDLLSFDPVSDYPSLDSMGGMGGMGAGNVTTGNELAHYSTEPDPRREEFVRSIQSLVPASVNAGPMGRLQSPFDATPCQTRGSRPQSRRLYQRANAAAAALQAGSSDDSFSFKGFRSALPTGTSNLSKASGAGTESTTGAAATGGGVEIGSTASQKLGNSPRARNIGGSTMSSDPPTRVVSPAENFSHSSLSSHSSPHDFYPRAGYDEYQIFQSHAHHHPPGAIGSKVVQRKVSDDVFDLGTGRK